MALVNKIVSLETDERKPSVGSATSGTEQTSKRYLTPNGVAERWTMHPESIRRMLRQRRMASHIISRRRLIEIAEVERVEAAGLVTRAV